MKTLYSIPAVISLCATTMVYGASMGNPTPGFPHDTLNFHVKKDNGPVDCSGGGHAAFIKYDDVTGKILPAEIRITMEDWVQIDNDNDGFFDEDTTADGVDDDDDLSRSGIFLDGEDPVEPGNKTGFMDCDGSDGVITLKIRDTDPRAGVISTQEWYIRMVGKPEESLAFWTNAQQATCEVVDPGPDLTVGTADDVIECSFGETDTDWVKLGYVDASSYDGQTCAKQVKLGGKNTSKGGGKTAFCNITNEFLVDVDTDGDDLADMFSQYLFSISCPDDPDTEVDESAECPLSQMIWDVDTREDYTTTKAKAQVFIGHTDSTSIKGGKITGKSKQ
jgi:hypothetical protein